MTQIEIYTKTFCPYCISAKALLDEMKLSYTEYELTFDLAREAEMITRSGKFTVPQIFVENQPIGGSDELFEMVDNGTFLSLLNPSAEVSNTSQEVVSHV